MDKDSIVECDFDEITSNSVSVVALVSDLMDQSKLRLAMPSICFVKEVSELIDLDVDLVVVDLSKAAGCERVLPRSKFFRDFQSLVNGVLKLN